MFFGKQFTKLVDYLIRLSSVIACLIFSWVHLLRVVLDTAPLCYTSTKVMLFILKTWVVRSCWWKPILWKIYL